MLDSSKFWKQTSTNTGRFTTTKVFLLPDDKNITKTNGLIDVEKYLDISEQVMQLQLKSEIDSGSFQSYIGAHAYRDLKFDTKLRFDDINDKFVLVRSGVTNVEPPIGGEPEYEYIDIGIFKVITSKYDKKRDRTINIECRDRLYLFDVKVDQSDFTTLVGNTVFDVTKDYCTKHNISLDENWDSAKLIKIKTMKDKGYDTPLEFFKDMAAASMTFVRLIDLGDEYKLSFSGLHTKPIDDFSVDFVFDVTEGDKLTPVNQLNLTSTLGDNVTVKDDEMIEATGVSELRVENVEVIRDNKEDNIDTMFNIVKGMTHWALDVSYPGDPTIEVGDLILFRDKNDVNREIFVTELEFTDKGAWKGTLKSVILDKEKATSNFKGTYNERIKVTEAQVNKVDQEIKLLVKNIDKIVDKQVELSFDKLQVGGHNLLINSETPTGEGGDDLKITVLPSTNTQVQRVSDGTNTKMTWTTFQTEAQAATIESFLQEGDDVIFSFYARTDSGQVDVPHIHFLEGEKPVINHDVKIKSEWTRIFVRYQWVKGKTFTLIMDFADLEINKWIEFKNFQLEKGTVATQWHISDEEWKEISTFLRNKIDDAETVIEEHGTNIQQNLESIELEAASRIAADEEILEETSAKLKVVQDEISFEFVRVDGKIEENEVTLNELKTYYRYTADGAIIGKEGDPMQFTFSNDEAAFLENGNKISYWKGRVFYVENLEVLNTIIIGNHLIESVGDNTLVRSVK